MPDRDRIPHTHQRTAVAADLERVATILEDRMHDHLEKGRDLAGRQLKDWVAFLRQGARQERRRAAAHPTPTVGERT